jgi:hypothetical protein
MSGGISLTPADFPAELKPVFSVLHFAFGLLVSPRVFCFPPSAFWFLPSAHCLLPTAFCLLPFSLSSVQQSPQIKLNPLVSS